MPHSACGHVSISCLYPVYIPPCLFSISCLTSPLLRLPCQALVGLIRNLALNHENHSPLRQQAVIPKLWNILTRAYTNSSKRGVPGGPPGYIVSHVHCTLSSQFAVVY